jgi:hypothetical protein
MLLPHSSRSQIRIKIGSKNVKNALKLALGVRIVSRIPVICGAFESAWRVECAEMFRKIFYQSISLKQLVIANIGKH